MSRKIVFDNTDDIIKLYSAGMSGNDIACKLGVSPNCIFRLLHKNNVPIIKSRARVRPSIDTIMGVYNSGTGASGVAKALGCGRGYVNMMLDKHGIHKRNQSEQQFERMRKASPEERQALTKAAHDAVRGKERPEDEIIERAKLRYATKHVRISEHETRLAEILESRNISFDTQIQVGRYNCDFVINGIAVEIMGGQWHLFGPHAARFDKRTRCFFDSGYDILFVFLRSGYAVDSTMTDHIMSSVDILGKDKTGVCKYRVIWSGLDCFTGQSSDSDHLAIVVPFTNRKNSANGRYERIPR